MRVPLSILILKIGFWLIGGSALLIGTSTFLFGIAFTADLAARLFAPLGTAPGGFADLTTANADNELRFYAVFWAAYGAALIRTAMGLPATLNWVLPLSALFLMGGIGRLLSVAAVGWPDFLFTLLMITEFATSALFIVAWVFAHRSQTGR